MHVAGNNETFAANGLSSGSPGRGDMFEVGESDVVRVDDGVGDDVSCAPGLEQPQEAHRFFGGEGDVVSEPY